jgi:hypothetical protein
VSRPYVIRKLVEALHGIAARYGGLSAGNHEDYEGLRDEAAEAIDRRLAHGEPHTPEERDAAAAEFAADEWNSFYEDEVFGD